MFSTLDRIFMKVALEQAKECFKLSEVPVGAAVVLQDGLVIARGNAQIRQHDSLAHAEVRALNAACFDSTFDNKVIYNDKEFCINKESTIEQHRMLEKKRLRRRLDGSTLYVTVEPCLMCLGACLLHRVNRVVFGTKNNKFGALSNGTGCFNNNNGIDLQSSLDASYNEGLVWPLIKKGAASGQHFNHQLILQGGCEEEESAQLMQEFFKQRRK
jgi:tRNA(adenine34) deaminase